MALRSRYRRKAPSPEAQGLFFNKAQVSPAFFNPGQSVVQRQEGVTPVKQEEEKPVQKQVKEEEKPVQKQDREEEPPVQKQMKKEEEKPVQKQVKEEEKPVQKQDSQKDQESAQPKGSPYRLRSSSEEQQEPTRLPEHLKAGIEALSGVVMDDVRVHYNSPKPLRMQALAYTQGTDIYLAPGQEKHLSHEAWHVVQQKQGRVMPTLQTKGINVNDDPGLEQEATNMGQKAIEQSSNHQSSSPT